MATTKTTVTPSWQSVTITTDETWFASGPHGILLGDATQPATEDDGFPLARGASTTFGSGVKVYYRSAGSENTYVHRLGVSL